MTKDEALTMALEALENAKLILIGLQTIGIKAGATSQAMRLGEQFIQDRAITAIKEALAQPEQESVGLLSDEVVENAGREWWAQTRHTNGPRILAVYASQSIMDEVHSTARIIMQAALNQITSPPQRQPLQAHEIVTMYDESPTSDSDMIAFARAIEQAHSIGKNT